jgi:hypothetical protein
LDDESVCELTVDELERNLEMLRSRLAVQPDEQRLTGPKLGLEKISEAKTGLEWKKVESKRSLGYMGLSDHTHRRREKEAQDHAGAREGFKMS